MLYPDWPGERVTQRTWCVIANSRKKQENKATTLIEMKKNTTSSWKRSWKSKNGVRKSSLCSDFQPFGNYSDWIIVQNLHSRNQIRTKTTRSRAFSEQWKQKFITFRPDIWYSCFPVSRAWKISPVSNFQVLKNPFLSRLISNLAKKPW